MDTLSELKTLKEGYELAQKRLSDYSSGTLQQINIPICSVAFIQGTLTNPNEVFICLSPELTLKSDHESTAFIISKKLAGNPYLDLTAEIKQLSPQDPEPIEKLFEKLKILEHQENLTPCLGEIQEKPDLSKPEKPQEDKKKEEKKDKEQHVKEKEEEEKKTSANIPPPAKLSKFKQEMQAKKHS